MTNKLFKYTGILAIIILFLSSCYKDIGNYSYHDINNVQLGNIDTANGYTVFFNDTLKVTPDIRSTQNVTAEDAYTYLWSYHKSSSVSTIDDSLLATTRNLAAKVTMPPGNYVLMYKVTDKKTGVMVHMKTTLTVSTEVYEGFMVLSDVNNQSRMDMLSYVKKTNTFNQYTDVFNRVNSTVPMNGTPYQVLCMPYVGSNVAAQNYGIFVLNAAGTNRVNQETFAWNNTYNIRYLVVGNIPSNLVATRLTGITTGAYSYLIYMYGPDKNMYSYSTNAGYAFRYSPVNVYETAGTPFRVSPYVATDGTSSLLYNMDKKTFVTVSNPSAVTVTDAIPALGYPTGLDLLYMECIYYAEAGIKPNTYAVLKDPATQKVYLLNFLMRQAQTYYQEMTATDIGQATNFAASPDHNYIFYSVGGKLYEYDMYLKKSILMADYGNSLITHLSFPHISSRYGKPNYITWSKSLLVGSYDPAGAKDSNGKLELFTISDINAPLVKTNSWTGFGKIVSVGYRDR
ncbi:PKD-like family lipoprotein [Chitinophaga arvensicola]|uniref:PKD-like family protein n=1 Tax=Chitinophaga arvensicola TaxID=29529 RepID=A0A1I0R3S3_9BACT|nr:PKD-like family lipoprotein [Chitinophaga arvensicola]SEW35032.1 PKD-like family protein [Chitinophaga arvensicola]